jgi:signal transduction histidine kinase/ligand-binding sensor protein
MDILKYMREFEPVNILDVFDRSALTALLNGYSYAQGSGITVTYPLDLVPTMQSIKRIDARGEEYYDTFNPICRKWRSPAPEGCDQEQVCFRADERETLKYYKGTWTGPRLYRCEPLGLWDMSYPLYIGKRIVGVLFAGQTLILDEVVNWREELKQYKDYVDWNACPDEDNQFRAVKNGIIARTPEPQRQIMLEAIEAEKAKARNADMDLLRKRIKNFLDFGDITQQLINRLYAARKSVAEQQLIRACDQDLANIEFSDQGQWWKECGQRLQFLPDLPGVEKVNLYVQQGSDFICQVTIPAGPELPDPLPSVDVIPAFFPGSLTAISREENGALLEKIALDHEGVWGFLEEFASGEDRCCTLMTLKGGIQEEQFIFLNELCNAICMMGNLARLIFRERDADQTFRRKVANVSHAFRTPLQILELDLEYLYNNRTIANQPDLLKRITEGLASIQEAKEDIRNLRDVPAPSRMINLVEVLNKAIANVEPLARSHPCEIFRVPTWPDSIPIKAVQYKVQSALICLLDNAIKYSYFGGRNSKGELYQVRVSVEWIRGYAVINISNFGIGIPEADLKAIRERGFRAKVADEKKERQGTGLGLTYAIEVFEELGGWIKVTSWPSTTASEEDREKYQRFVTNVEAAIPFQWRS